MVSVDHFRQELLAQMDRAARGGRVDVLINCGELCLSISRDNVQSKQSSDAMQAEIKPGDTTIFDRTSGAGMTVRYLLPRAN
jgi:hypothetical protein